MTTAKKGEAAPVPPTQPMQPTTACVITARVDGVFVAGQRHPARETDYPDGWFSAAQMRELQAHPDLDVAGVLDSGA